MKHRLLFIVLAGILFTGCDATDDRVTVTFNVGRDPTGAHYGIIRHFEEQYPHIRVQVVESPQDASLQHDLYVTRFAGKDRSIDVIALDVIWIAEFARAGWLLPLEDFAVELPLDDFLKGPIEACTYRETLYAIPWFTDAGLLYYRKDLLTEYGLKEPETWNDLQDAVRTIRHDNPHMSGFVLQAEQYEGLICNVMEFIWSHGGDVWDEDGRWQLASPEAEAALQRLIDFIRAGDITPRGVLTYQEEESRHVFQDGRAIFLRNWPYVWELANNPATGSNVVGNIGIAPLPGSEPGRHAATLGGWNLGISAFSEHPEESWKLVRFFMEYEQMKQFSLEGGRLPTRISLYRDPEILERSPYFEDLFEVFINARPRPVTPHYSQISDIMQVNIHRALLGRITVREALERIDAEVLALFERYGK
jgi:multiple sugar transport system substrate-binding protein